MSKKRDLKQEKKEADEMEVDLWYRVYPGGAVGTDPVAYEQGSGVQVMRAIEELFDDYA